MSPCRHANTTLTRQLSRQDGSKSPTWSVSAPTCRRVYCSSLGSRTFVSNGRSRHAWMILKIPSWWFHRSRCHSCAQNVCDFFSADADHSILVCLYCNVCNVMKCCSCIMFTKLKCCFIAVDIHVEKHANSLRTFHWPIICKATQC